MAELETFNNFISDKSKNTIKAYNTQYKKLHSLLGKDISDTSQKKVIDTIKELDNSNSKQALLNIAILIRTYNKNDIKELDKYRDTLKKEIKETQKKNNTHLSETLPTYEELQEYTESLKGKNDIHFIINYILMNYNVRNEDLRFKIVDRKKDTADTSFNYIWLSPKKAEYIRNVYKTSDTYGKKVNIITDKPFMSAVRKLMKDKWEAPAMEQIPYIIKKATLLGIGEGNYNKIIINKFRDNVDKLKEISNNRGTSITTLLDVYDITNQ